LPSGKKLGTLVWSFRRKIGGGDIPKKIGWHSDNLKWHSENIMVTFRFINVVRYFFSKICDFLHPPVFYTPPHTLPWSSFLLHNTTFTKRNVTQIFSECHFKLSECHPIFFGMSPPPIFLLELQTKVANFSPQGNLQVQYSPNASEFFEWVVGFECQNYLRIN
jgi:hypothetical protein